MIVGDFPSTHDQDTGTVFGGYPGNLLKATLSRHGVDFNECLARTVLPFAGDLKSIVTTRTLGEASLGEVTKGK